jgi:phytoene desaturase
VGDVATKRIAIVGAGMGGLAAAIRLRLMGFDVEIFEKNGQPGGRVGRLREDGFTFDTGPTLLLMTDVYRDLFTAAGKDLDEEIELVHLDPNYRVHFGRRLWRRSPGRRLKTLFSGRSRTRCSHAA